MHPGMAERHVRVRAIFMLQQGVNFERSLHNTAMDWQNQMQDYGLAMVY